MTVGLSKTSRQGYKYISSTNELPYSLPLLVLEALQAKNLHSCVDCGISAVVRHLLPSIHLSIVALHLVVWSINTCHGISAGRYISAQGYVPDPPSLFSLSGGSEDKTKLVFQTIMHNFVLISNITILCRW